MVFFVFLVIFVFELRSLRVRRVITGDRIRTIAHMRWSTRVAVFITILSVQLGCHAPVDRQMNAQTVALEQRVRNHTRSAVFADMTPPQEGNRSAIKSERAIAATGADVPPPDNDGTFVGLAISGGGSRSANFAAACMFQLQRLGLLQKVDYISTVSGGSLTGAYYCSAADREWNPGAVQKKLTYHYASDLLHRTFLPWDDLAFVFSDLNRSDLLAGVFEEQLLGKNGRPLTFTDLRADRPRLLINATDVQSARRFVFCNETFDGLNSDLEHYPLAYAVTASAAVPILLHPVALEDYSTTFPQFRHLVDGGVTDNLGVQTLVETYSAQVRQAADQGRPTPYPRGAVFVMIDAHTRFNSALADRRDIGIIGNLKSAAGLMSTALLNRASSATLAEMIVNGAADAETAEQMRKDIAQLNDQGYLRFTDKRDHPVRVIYLSLAQVNTLQNLPSGSFSESVNSIGTYFNIHPTEAYSLYAAADLLIKERFEPIIREVVKEISGTPATRDNAP